VTAVRVIGAGVSGLAAAWCLRERGCDVEVVEAASGPGGLIHTHRSSFGLIETAANAFVWTPVVRRWFEALDLTPYFPLPSSRARYIWRDGRARRWPLTPVETAALAVHLAGATMTKRRAPRPAETVRAWSNRALGSAATRWLVGPALQGIYAAAPEELSAPLVIGGHRRGRRQLAAPAGGMGQFVDRLHARLVDRGVTFRFGRTMTSIDRHVPTVVATSASSAARLVAPIVPALGAALANVELLPLTTVTAFFPDDPRDRHGFGVLFPRRTGVRALGVLFNADIFSGRSHVRSETWIYGGVAPDEDVAATLLGDRAQFTGRSVAPLDISVTAWAEAVPRYDEAVTAVQRAIRERPLTNLSLTGNFVGRIGVAGLLERAEEAAASLNLTSKP
jgi:protoporphyrinogen/coproporphyrinogen III oxidase